MTAAFRLFQPEDTVLQVRGLDGDCRSLLAGDWADLPIHETAPLPIVCMTGREVRPARIYRGVQLIAVLALCGLSAVPRPQLKQSLVLCHAADGYRALFTWHELFNTVGGEQVLLVTEPHGGLTLVAAADRRAGPRNMQGVVSIEVLELPAPAADQPP
ncbi:MAG: hypothetical protein REU00_05640 [Pseudomonadota bacterium]|nr:hypothetical protein [Pseudomonadota bacterium]